MNRVSLGTAEI